MAKDVETAVISCLAIVILIPLFIGVSTAILYFIWNVVVLWGFPALPAASWFQCFVVSLALMLFKLLIGFGSSSK